MKLWFPDTSSPVGIKRESRFPNNEFGTTNPPDVKEFGKNRELPRNCIRHLFLEPLTRSP